MTGAGNGKDTLDKGKPEGYDDALADAVQHTKARIAAAETPQERREIPENVKWGVLVVLVALAAWIVIAPPALLQGPQELVVTPTIDETGVRMEMWIQVGLIEDFQVANSRLPRSAEEAGEVIEGVTYQMLNDSVYSVTGQGESFTLTWTSTEADEALLGDAPNAVRAGVVNES